jgi:hypothetical protein
MLRFFIGLRLALEPNLGFEVNDHPYNGWLEFLARGRKGKSTSVL